MTSRLRLVCQLLIIANQAYHSCMSLVMLDLPPEPSLASQSLHGVDLILLLLLLLLKDA